jgi:ketosteroid isomerase-like protein
MTEAQVRERVGELAQAVAAKDIDRLMSFYGPDIVSFDINPPLRYSGTERKRHAWQDVFTLYVAGPLSYDMRELKITAQGDIAFAHSLNHITGVLANGHATAMWVRWTACFERIRGVWLVVHDHVSVPADLAHGKAAVTLTP